MFVVDNPTHPFAPTGFLVGSSVGAFFSTPPRSYVNPLSISQEKRLAMGMEFLTLAALRWLFRQTS
jgi:hypothetical protein